MRCTVTIWKGIYDHRRRNGLASGGAEGHGAELMINIAIVSMHAILYIDFLGPTFCYEWGAWPPAPLFRRHDDASILYYLCFVSIMHTVCTLRLSGRVV